MKTSKKICKELYIYKQSFCIKNTINTNSEVIIYSMPANKSFGEKTVHTKRWYRWAMTMSRYEGRGKVTENIRLK